MTRALSCTFCHATLTQGAPLMEKNNVAICGPCVDGFSTLFAERAWVMATTLEEQLDVLLDQSQRALEHSAALAARARSCGISLAELVGASRKSLS